MARPRLNLVRLVDTPIFDQLRIEEALLRTQRGNWCVPPRQLTPTASSFACAVAAQSADVARVAATLACPVLSAATGPFSTAGCRRPPS
jgi:hypothetical protein